MNENLNSHALLRRAMRHLEQWHSKYGKYSPEWLPPAGDVSLMEDIDAHLNGNQSNQKALEDLDIVISGESEEPFLGDAVRRLRNYIERVK